MVALRGRRRLARHVVPRDARRRQRGADREGRGADRLRLGLPRRHLRHVQPRRSTACRTGPTAATTVCQLHMRQFKDGDTITIEPWRATAFPVHKDLVVDRGAFDRHHRGGRLRLGQHRQRAGRPTPSRSRRTSPRRRWTRRRASAAAPAWPPARTRRRRCSSARRSRTSRCCRRGTPSARAACAAMVRADGRRRLRQLLERRRVRGGLPEGDLDREHRADAPGVRACHVARRKIVSARVETSSSLGQLPALRFPAFNRFCGKLC